MSKRVLITAGGTGIAWHLAQVAQRYFRESLDIRVCDINAPYLLPVTTLGIPSYQVPLSSDPLYMECLGTLLKENGIEIIVPLLPVETEMFSADSDFVRAHGLITTAPKRSVVLALSDKRELFHTLSALEIETPSLFNPCDVESGTCYWIKPVWGFGSRNMVAVRGEDILKGKVKFDAENEILQEDCRGKDYREVTVEIFNGVDSLHVFARERVAVKAGVCVKARPVDPTPFIPAVERLTKNLECPRVFNVQFLYHGGVWKLFDCNLRLGAGSALSDAAGFHLARALWADLLRMPVSDDFFRVDRSVQSVLRVYQEVVVR